MPSGAKKRKAAKKKKVHIPSSTNPHQGEDGSGELSSPASQDNQNTLVQSVEVEAKQTNGDENTIEIETGEKSKSSNGSSSSSSSSSDDESKDKKEAVTEPPPIESIPQTDTIENIEVTPIVDETKVEESIPPVESEAPPIVDPVVKVYDETKNEEREEIVVTETPEVIEEPIVSKDEIPITSVDESVSKDSPAVKLLPTPQVHGTDRAHETDTVEHADRKAVVASPPIEERQVASWKNCCGIFELFSGSGR